MLAVVVWAASAGDAPATDPAAASARASAPAATATPPPTVSPEPIGLARASDPRAGRWSSRDVGPTPPEYLTGYRWPVEHARITNAFGPGRPGNEVVDGEMMHDGIDVSSFCGGHVLAAHDGVVLAAGRRYEQYVGWVGDLAPYRDRLDRGHAWGRLAIAVVVDDGNGYRSIYLHLNLATVEKGDVVRAGQMLGYQGSTGESTGCHLHYSLFSPLESGTILLDPKVAASTKLPPQKIARIDPLLVLPPLAAGFISWGWGAGGPS
jgi:murein DD-endopeptidase MepM/ murein hydrolase activator NlpD